MEEVDQFVIFMATYELYTFIEEHETCPIASKFKVFITNLLNLCINEFDENIYVVDTRKRAAQEKPKMVAPPKPCAHVPPAQHSPLPASPLTLLSTPW